MVRYCCAKVTPKRADKNHLKNKSLQKSQVSEVDISKNRYCAVRDVQQAKYGFFVIDFLVGRAVALEIAAPVKS